MDEQRQDQGGGPEGPEQLDRVERETLLEAEPAEVWRALTDPDELGWLGEDASISPEPGGAIDLGVDGEPRTGWVEEVEPERRLTVWWAAPGEESTRVSFELLPTEGGTLLRVVESRPLARIELVAAGFAAGRSAGERSSGGASAPQAQALALA